MNTSFLHFYHRPGRALLGGLCLALLPLLGWGQSAAGQLALEENFDYPSGTQLAASQTTASATGWYQNGTTTGNTITTTTGNLSSINHQYPQGVLAASPAGTSSEVSLATSGQSVYKNFTQPTGATAVYAAALLTVNSAQTGGDYFLHFINAATPGSATDVRGQLYVRAVLGSTTTFNFGLALADAVPFSYGTTAYNIGTTYLVVVKYENSPATNGVDVTSLFVLPPTAVPTTEPTTPEVSSPNSVTTAALPLNAIGLRQGAAGNAPTVTLDALRIASGWGSAVGRVVYTSGTSTVVPGDYYSLRVLNAGTVATVSSTGPGNGVTAATSVTLEKQLNLDGGQVATSTTNVLLLRARNVIGDGFEILANSGTSYVDGPVSREVVGSPSILFPVGRNGNYRPITLSINAAPAGTTIYTGSQTDASAYSVDGTVNSPLVRVSRIRYYTITPSPVPAAGSFTGTVALTIGSDDGVTDPSLASLVVAKSNGAGWNNLSRTSNTSTTVTSALFADFSNFALASTDPSANANPLPVSLTSFAATRSASAVALTWATASEHNSARFEVERSLDGTSFAPVATVAAHGTSLTPLSYAAFDRSAPAADLYYRLRTVDTDGSSRYSTVVVVAGEAAALTLSPNPAHDNVSLTTAVATPYLVRSALGQVVLRGTTLAGSTSTVEVGSLAPGVYFVELQAPTGRLVRKLVKE